MTLVNHYMSAESLLPWNQDGKLPPTGDLRDIVMVAGTDPYVWKGIVNANRPYLRAEAPAARIDGLSSCVAIAAALCAAHAASLTHDLIGVVSNATLAEGL
jgi:hypothetical protein